MEWTQSGDDVFVRLDPGEEIHSSLQSLADTIGFDAAAITSGIGRTRDSVYGYMDDNHVYHRITHTCTYTRSHDTTTDETTHYIHTSHTQTADK